MWCHNSVKKKLFFAEFISSKMPYLRNTSFLAGILLPRYPKIKLFKIHSSVTKNLILFWVISARDVAKFKFILLFCKVHNACSMTIKNKITSICVNLKIPLTTKLQVYDHGETNLILKGTKTVWLTQIKYLTKVHT